MSHPYPLCLQKPSGVRTELLTSALCCVRACRWCVQAVVIQFCLTSLRVTPLAFLIIFLTCLFFFWNAINLRKKRTVIGDLPWGGLWHLTPVSRSRVVLLTGAAIQLRSSLHLRAASPFVCSNERESEHFACSVIQIVHSDIYVKTIILGLKSINLCFQTYCFKHIPRLQKVLFSAPVGDLLTSCISG